MEAVASWPAPISVGLVLFVVQLVILTDFGAGAPIFFPILRRFFFKPFQPTPAYQRLKSRYVI
jgi:hypothetical protein